MGLKTRIKQASKDQEFVDFTRKELEKMGEEIYTSLAYAPPVDRKRLNAALDEMDSLLDDLEGKHLMEERQAIHKSGAIYQFKVALKESHPPIWRRIQVRDCTLGELHEVLQVIMGWEDCHLHQFIVRGEHYGRPDPEDRGWDVEMEDEEKISISKIAKTGRKVPFIYEYGFGDSGSMRSSWRRPWNQSRTLRTPAASKGRERVHQRTWRHLGLCRVPRSHRRPESRRAR